MLQRSLALCFFYVTVAISTAFAQSNNRSDYDDLGMVKVWTILHDKSGDQGCYAAATYRGGTVFTFGKKGPNGNWMTQVTNEKWSSIKKGETYKIEFIFDRRNKWSGEQTGIKDGFKSEGVKEAFFSDLGRLSRLRIKYEGREVDRLSLRGTSAALKAVKSCYQQRVEKADPFASDDPFASGANPSSDTSNDTDGSSTPVSLPSSAPFQFDQFAVNAIHKGATRLPDFSGAQKAYRTYRTRIRNGMRQGPDFAGRYSVIQIGCGTGCSFVYIGNNSTGKVYDFLRGGDENVYLNLLYRIDSNLLVSQWSDFKKCFIEYFYWSGDKFTLLKKTEVGPTESCYEDIVENIAAADSKTAGRL